MATDTLTLPQPSAVTDPAGKSAPKIHLGYLDSLRALAALHVVLAYILFLACERPFLNRRVVLNTN